MAWYGDTSDLNKSGGFFGGSQNAYAAKQAAGGLQALIQNYNQAYAEAKSANEARYQQMLGIADQTTGQRMSDVANAYGRQSSDVMQQLARLGMGNTTVAPTLQLGVEREKQAALNRTADEMQQTKLGIIERRQDDYPDSGSIAELVTALMGAYGAQGGGSIATALSGMRF